MPNSALPPNLKGKKHWDYPPGFRWIPRAWTSWKWGEPTLKWGNQWINFVRGHPLPVGEPNSWQVSVFPGAPWFACWYVAFTWGLWHFRIGSRWDDVDDYVTWPNLAVHKYKRVSDIIHVTRGYVS